MPASLLEILRSIPDHRRAEGKRFDLATVVLYSILGMVAGANSYRQMHEFIRVHLQRLNGAFGLRLPYSPSYTGLRLIIQGVNPAALEAAFRQHASSISAPTPSDSLPAIAVDGKTLRGSFDAFSDRKAAHMMSALRQADQIVLGHLMVAEKSNENPGRARADRGPRPEGLCVHARRRTRPKKSFERVIASGNHLLTQVKDNQPSLRRRLELGVAGRKPSGSAKTETTGRNRWETRELTVFPAKAWFRDTPWEKLIKTVLRLERTVSSAPGDWTLRANDRGRLLDFLASNQMPQRWNEWIRAHWRIENGSHYVRDTAFAEDASRIRKTPTSPLAYDPSLTI